MRVKIYLLLSYKGGWVKTPALLNARDSGLTFFQTK